MPNDDLSNSVTAGVRTRGSSLSDCPFLSDATHDKEDAVADVAAPEALGEEGEAAGADSAFLDTMPRAVEGLRVQNFATPEQPSTREFSVTTSQALNRPADSHICLVIVRAS